MDFVCGDRDGSHRLDELPGDGNGTLVGRGDGVEGTDGEVDGVIADASRTEICDHSSNGSVTPVDLDVRSTVRRRRRSTVVVPVLSGKRDKGGRVRVVVSTRTGVAVLVEVGSLTVVVSTVVGSSGGGLSGSLVGRGRGDPGGGGGNVGGRGFLPGGGGGRSLVGRRSLGGGRALDLDGGDGLDRGRSSGLGLGGGGGGSRGGEDAQGSVLAVSGVSDNGQVLGGGGSDVGNTLSDGAGSSNEFLK